MPYVTKKKLLAGLSKAYKEGESSRDLEVLRLVTRLKEALEINERVHEVADKLTKVSVQRSDYGGLPKLRVCVELDAECIQRGLIHGNDDIMIDAIGQDIGLRVAYKIRQMNFERWER